MLCEAQAPRHILVSHCNQVCRLCKKEISSSTYTHCLSMTIVFSAQEDAQITRLTQFASLFTHLLILTPLVPLVLNLECCLVRVRALTESLMSS